MADAYPIPAEALDVSHRTASHLLLVAKTFDRDHMPSTADMLRRTAATIEDYRLTMLAYREALVAISRGRVGAKGYREFARSTLESLHR